MTARRQDAPPDFIHARKVFHPGRFIAAIIALLIVAMIVDQLIHNQAFDWRFTFAAMGQAPVIEGFVKGTLLVTLFAMLLGVLLGVLISVMRLSQNPVLRGFAFAYTWFFRSVPRYVLLAIMGSAGLFFPGAILPIGVPYDTQILSWFGIEGTMRIANLDANQVFTGMAGAVLAMGLSESAYMAEIARSGIISVDKGQMEAAKALGLSHGQAMRRIILPQAMRVIVPPTGNETIAMFKDTSLLSALPLTTEMFFQIQQIGIKYYRPMPALVGATVYYLLSTSILMAIQSRIEAHFGRGYAPTSDNGRKTADTTPVRFPGSDH